MKQYVDLVWLNTQHRKMTGLKHMKIVNSSGLWVRIMDVLHFSSYVFYIFYNKSVLLLQLENRK